MKKFIYFFLMLTFSCNNFKNNLNCNDKIKNINTGISNLFKIGLQITKKINKLKDPKIFRDSEDYHKIEKELKKLKAKQEILLLKLKIFFEQKMIEALELKQKDFFLDIENNNLLRLKDPRFKSFIEYFSNKKTAYLIINTNYGLFKIDKLFENKLSIKDIYRKKNNKIYLNILTLLHFLGLDRNSGYSHIKKDGVPKFHIENYEYLVEIK